MSKEFKYVIASILTCLIVGALLGFFIGRDSKKGNPIPPVVPDTVEEEAKIDSLNTIIDKQYEEIAKLNEELAKKPKEIIREIEKIKYLPADTNLALMKDNLIAYGELTEAEDTLPILIESDDSSEVQVLISENNMKDVNIISAKYINELETNELLYKKLDADSLIIESKDSIILQSSIILEKHEEAYNINMASLQANLEKERKDKIKRTAILGSTTALFAILTTVLVIKK